MAKRRLRSDTTAEADTTAETAGATEAPQPEPTAKAPRAKKQKVQPVRYLCTVCDTQRVANSFPDYNPSPDCDHSIHTCKNCLKQWVQSEIESSHYATGEDGKLFGVRCPECPAVMRSVNIQIAATKKVYAQFEERERHHISESIPGWRWCLQPDCKAGQVHEKKNVPATETAGMAKPEEEAEEKENEPKPKTKGKSKAKPKKKAMAAKADAEEAAEPELVEDICTCHKCGAKACVNCDRPWHEGESCKEYQARLKDRLAEEDLSVREINKVTRKCPKCSKNIQKNGGCPSMVCTQCYTSFCWTCMAAFEHHRCKCHPPPPPPPQPAQPLLPPQLAPPGPVSRDPRAVPAFPNRPRGP